MHKRTASVLIFVVLLFATSLLAAQSLGIFENHQDVGSVQHAGTAEYDASTKTYTLTASGTNIWANTDAFQFVWKKMSGDLSLAADIKMLSSGGNPHKKAVLMIRQTLDADSPYVDVAVHGIGMTALQFRDTKGSGTQEIESNITGPVRVRINRRGDFFYLYIAATSESPLIPAGASFKLALQGDFYVGIGLCAHDNNDVVKASFSKVELKTLATATGEPVLYSTLETQEIGSTNRRVEYVSPTHFEAPNWTRDGQAFLFNRDGHIERLPRDSSTPEIIDTGAENRCNNDHGISPDGKQLAISDNSQGDRQSMVYVLPITGGSPRRLTPKSPSYWHGWSPDGKTLAFVGQRNNDFDIYTVPVTGGEETRLTTAKGLDDGPEYSPDGKYIYFNSERTGHMQIWRMNADGSEQVQITKGDQNDWFPHISPDGKQMVFVSFDPSVTGHPPNKDVQIRMMSLADGKITVLSKLFGGQGTMNVPSWAPDSTKFAFVSYELIPKEDLAQTQATIPQPPAHLTAVVH